MESISPFVDYLYIGLYLHEFSRQAAITNYPSMQSEICGRDSSIITSLPDSDLIIDCTAESGYFVLLNLIVSLQLHIYCIYILIVCFTSGWDKLSIDAQLLYVVLN
jgi:hypothetical protein